jgi:quercetin dioxygenase-like cupin family protein
MKLRWLALTSIGLALSAPAFADETAAKADAAQPAAAPAAQHAMYAPADLKWADAPPALPKGAKVAVLQGDPAAPGPFTMRITVPAGYKVPPHFHPADENLTVISGDMQMALGDKWDESKGHPLAVGSFATMPKGVHHYAWSKGGAVFQLHGIGPWGITYLNPADDPRNTKEASK